MISQFTISLGFFSLTVSRLPKDEVIQRLTEERVDQTAIAKASSKLLFSLMTGAAHGRALVHNLRPLLSSRAIASARRDALTANIHSLSAWVKEVDALSSHISHFAGHQARKAQSHAQARS